VTERFDLLPVEMVALSSPNMPHYSISVEHMQVLHSNPILIYANSMGVCVDVVLCVGGWCFDY